MFTFWGIGVIIPQPSEKEEKSMGNRKDSKGRLLKENEQQRANGQYMYTYKEPSTGKTRFYYSWRLEKTDRNPAGKKLKAALREMEEELRKKAAVGISVRAESMTVEQAVTKYLLTKNNQRLSTRKGYVTTTRFLETQPLWKMKISDIATMDAKIIVGEWQTKQNKSYSQIHNYVGVLRPCFRMLVESDIIYKNPFDFKLSDVVVNNMQKRQALTTEDKNVYLKYIRNDEHYKRYYPIFHILFNTGIRVSELCALTIGDVNFEDSTILVSKQLFKEENGQYIVTPLKMKQADISRVIRVSPDTLEQFKIAIADRAKLKEELIVKDSRGNEYQGFIFLDKDRTPCVATNIESRFKWAYNKYERTYKRYIPRVTPHVCRHTYATELYRHGVSLKSAQYLLGHSSPDITARIYTDTDENRANEELAQLYKKKIVEEVGSEDFIDLDD
jgi:integrase